MSAGESLRPNGPTRDRCVVSALRALKSLVASYPGLTARALGISALAGLDSSSIHPRVRSTLPAGRSWGRRMIRQLIWLVSFVAAECAQGRVQSTGQPALIVSSSCWIV